MQIIVTREEIRDYRKRCQDWHAGLVVKTLEFLGPLPTEEKAREAFVSKSKHLKEQYEKTNPYPKFIQEL